MRVQPLSDIHLEFGPFDLPDTDADVIIAAGDIGLDETGTDWLQTLDKPVIFVAGNHDYWGTDMARATGNWRGRTADTNIHYLECDVAVIDDVRFIGTTLWTSYDNGNPDVLRFAGRWMNDFTRIRQGEQPLTPIDLLENHRQALHWLQRELDKPFAGKTVVVTHHAPSFSSWHKQDDEIAQYAYCSDLSELLTNADISLWVHGHVHHAFDYAVADTRVVCNPRGYINHQTIDGFRPDLVIDV